MELDRREHGKSVRPRCHSRRVESRRSTNHYSPPEQQKSVPLTNHRRQQSSPQRPYTPSRCVVRRPVGPATPLSSPKRVERATSTDDLDAIKPLATPTPRRVRQYPHGREVSRCNRKGQNKFNTTKAWIRARGRHDLLNLVKVNEVGNPDAKFLNELVRNVVRDRYFHWKKCWPPAGVNVFAIQIPFGGTDRIPEIPTVNSPEKYNAYCSLSCCQLLRDAKVIPFVSLPLPRPHVLHEDRAAINRQPSPPNHEPHRNPPEKDETSKLIEAHSRRIRDLTQQIKEKERRLGVHTFTIGIATFESSTANRATA